jgi:hypothetical protein
MNHQRILAPAIGLSLLAIAAGCTVEETVVMRPRPPERVEVIGVAPSRAHVWVRGHWEPSGGDWVWIQGRWVIR